MNLRNKFRQIPLASVFICFFIPQVQAGFWDDAVNKAKSATEKVINDTVGDGASNNSKSSDSSPEESTNTTSEKKKQVVKSSATTVTAASQHPDLDIIGLELGMTQEQAVAALKKHDKDFKITFDRAKSGNSYHSLSKESRFGNYLMALNAVIKNQNGGSEIVALGFAIPPSTSRVIRIKRSISFDKNSMPLKNIVRGALIKKYGVPTSEGTKLIWNYASNDNSVVKKDCASAIQGRAIKRTGYGSLTRVRLSCGLILNAEVVGLEIASQMYVELEDYRKSNRNKLATDEYLKQLKEQRRQDELKKSSQSSAPTL